MGKYDPAFPGELKYAWDNRFSKHERKVFVLCGSVSAWIAKNILRSKGFVGRISLNLVLKELPIRDCPEVVATGVMSTDTSGSFSGVCTEPSNFTVGKWAPGRSRLRVGERRPEVLSH